MDIKKIKYEFKNLIDRVVQEDFFGMAAEMSYMLALGIFPFMTFVAAVFGWLGKKYLVTSVLLFFQNFVPAEVIRLIKEVLREVILFEKGSLLAFVGLVVAIAISSNAFAIMMKGLNRAYNIAETRSFIHTRLLAVLVVFANTLLSFLCINLIIFGKVILNFVVNMLPATYLWTDVISIVRWPISFGMLYLMACLNYYILPNVNGPDHIKRRSTVLGSLFFCVFWLLGSTIYSVYINNLNTYNKVYGTLGAFAILLVWLYYSSLILLIGGEINSITYRKLLINKK